MSESKRRKVSIDFSKDPGVTKQSFKDECDINKILAKFQKQGVVTHVNNHSGSYSDIGYLDFTEAMQTVTRAQSMFNDLPSHLRKRFGHDPVEFLTFIQSEQPDDRREAVRLGLKAPESIQDLENEEPVTQQPGEAGPPVPGAD